jgi:REP element-mobilizing transposase RayT
MRAKRILVQGASWYEVRTAVNNREPLFWRRQATAIFCRVLGEAWKRFVFELRGFRLEKEWLSFYIKPAEGLQLPAIMQWVKQTFAVRFNLDMERTGHVWGDRYWSRVLEGEPPEWAAELGWEAVDVAAETGVLSSGGRPLDGVSPLTGENPAEGGFSPQNPAHSPPPPG